MNTALMFSKATDEWSTPPALFNTLNAEFAFELDVAATLENAKCAAYFTLTDNALMQDWRGRVCWMNPPYSKVRPFIAKAVTEAAKGATVVALVPVRSCTIWFHAYVWDRRHHRPYAGVELRLLKGRVTFVGAPHPAPFPSAVVVFRPGAVEPFELVQK